MSTKTLRKRVALVAVAALGAGLLSVAPASANSTDMFDMLGSAGETDYTNNQPQYTTAIDVTAGATSYVDLVGTDDAALTWHAGNPDNFSLRVAGPAGAITDKTTQTQDANYTQATITYASTDGTCTGFNNQSFSYVNPTEGSNHLMPTVTISGNVVSFSGNQVGPELASDVPGTNCVNTAGLDYSNVNTPASAPVNGETRIRIATPNVGTIFVTAFGDWDGVSGVQGRHVYRINVLGAQTSVATDVDWSEEGVGVQAGDKTVYAPAAVGSSWFPDIASIQADQKDQYGNYINDGSKLKTVTYTLTGVGSLDRVSNHIPSNYYYSVQSVTLSGSAADDTVYVFSDGRAGTATITGSIDGKVFVTRTVKFYGKATSLTVTPKLTVGRASNDPGEFSTGNNDGYTTGSSSSCECWSGPLDVVDEANSNTNAAFLISVKDALGTPVVVRPDSIVISSTNAAVAHAHNNYWFQDSGWGDYTTGALNIVGTWDSGNSSKSGDTATLTFTLTNLDGTILTGTMPVSIGGVVASEAITFDKTTYAPGTAVVVTRSAKDSAGNPVYDGATAPAVSGIVSLPAGTYTKGALSKTVYAPASAGAYVLSETSSAAGAPTVTGTLNVSSASDIVALTALISKLNAKVLALNKLIAKIQKKLGVRK